MVVDMALQTQRMTLDIVGLTAFSYDFQMLDRAARDPLVSTITSGGVGSGGGACSHLVFG